MVTEFQFVGLSKNKRFTLYDNTKKRDVFWSFSNLADDRFNALWNYFVGGGKWTGNEKAIIKHDGLTSQGTPITPVIIEVKLP